MPESNQTEKATPQRRKKAREQGQVARSREIGGTLAIVGAIVVTMAMCSSVPARWRALYVGLLQTATSGDIDAGGPVLFWSAIEVMRFAAPALLVAMLLSVGVTAAQGGVTLAPAALAIKPERLSPGSRMKQIFSITSLSGLAKSVLPFGVIALLAMNVMRNHWGDMVGASQQDLRVLAASTAAMTKEVAWKAVTVLLAWGALDYFIVWKQNESKLRMSMEEVKREHKENDGNPFTKAQIRRRQRAMRGRKPLEAAATATMIVTNPTHFAVALRYQPGMAAPEVVAKGTDLLAQKIKAIAAEHGVPIVENKPLARALYKSVEVGSSIPAELYQAVAEILVTVFRAQEEVKERQEDLRRRSAYAAGSEGGI